MTVDMPDVSSVYKSDNRMKAHIDARKRQARNENIVIAAVIVALAIAAGFWVYSSQKSIDARNEVDRCVRLAATEHAKPYNEDTWAEFATGCAVDIR